MAGPQLAKQQVQPAAPGEPGVGPDEPAGRRPVVDAVAQRDKHLAWRGFHRQVMKLELEHRHPDAVLPRKAEDLARVDELCQGVGVAVALIVEQPRQIIPARQPAGGTKGLLQLKQAGVGGRASRRTGKHRLQMRKRGTGRGTAQSVEVLQLGRSRANGDHVHLPVVEKDSSPPHAESSTGA
jgi:hypothetical protein